MFFLIKTFFTGILTLQEPGRSWAMWGHWHSGMFLSNLIARPIDQLSKTMCLPTHNEPSLGQGNGGRRDGCIKAAAVPFVTWLKSHVEMKAVNPAFLTFHGVGFSLTPFSFQ